MTLQLGEIETKYEILEKLGEGGMGAVFKARHRLLDEVRVIKAILPVHQGDEDLKLRFRREARAATRLRHPNIAQVHDLLVDDGGTTHIVMEYIEGRTLQQALWENGPPDLETGVEIASQALGAVGYLHSKGYLHRDISPDNLMLTRGFDGKVLVKLIDLGLAKRHVGSVGLTEPGVFMGKVRYSAPEQFADPDREFDPRSDIYSFGVVLYELLTGECPIRGETFAQIIASHLYHPVPDFTETNLGSRVPEELREITLSALAKEPSDRISTAELLLAALGPFRAEQALGKSEYLEGLLAAALEAKPQTSEATVGSEGALDPSAGKRPGAPRSASGSRPPSGSAPSGARSSEADRSDLTIGTIASVRRGSGSRPVNATVADLEATSELRGERLALAEEQTAAVASEGRSRNRVDSWALAGVALIALLVLGSRLLTPNQAPKTGETGSLRLDAVPWAEVREIRNQDGESEPLDGSMYTPIVLSLAPGSYEVSLAHPAFPEPQSVEVEITASESTEHRVEFEARAVESYFAAAGLVARLEEAGL